MNLDLSVANKITNIFICSFKVMDRCCSKNVPSNLAKVFLEVCNQYLLLKKQQTSVILVIQMKIIKLIFLVGFEFISSDGS